jgi:GTPase SAR1 family protein
MCNCQQEGHVIGNLIDIQRQLRNIPIVQLHIPTVVLVGAPNVGKSSIVKALSTGTPEVNNYPFTTRGMTLVSWLDTFKHTARMHALQYAVSLRIAGSFYDECAAQWRTTVAATVTA